MDGSADTLGCVSLRSSHLQALYLGARGKGAIWIMDIKGATLQAGGFCRGVFLRSPLGWGPAGTRL